MRRFDITTVLVWLALAVHARADIHRWDTGEVIPGTEGIVPGPGVQLDQRLLPYAELAGLDLTAANFEASYLPDARLSSSTLVGANFSESELGGADLSGADLTDATILGASLGSTTQFGFNSDQFYSTANYKQKNLQRVGLGGNDLTGWSFAAQNLSNADFASSTLTNTDLAEAIVNGTSFANTTHLGLTPDQLYSTASYQNQNLGGITLGYNDLSGWDFHGQDLTNAGFYDSTLSNTDFMDAIINGAAFDDTTGSGFTKEQLYSTLSYQQKNLRGVRLGSNNL